MGPRPRTSEATPERPPGAPRPTLAVVVPTLDEAERLPRLLARLSDPGAPPADRADEVVVADGGSRDGTPERARAAGATLVAAPRGRGAQLAAGAAAARAELLAFLHADAWPEPGVLAAARALFAAEPGLGAAALRQRVDAAGWRYRLVERAADARARRGTVYGDSGLVVRRSVYRAVGGFRPLALFEDVDLSRRLRETGPVRLVEGGRLVVSARRWEREGFLRCTLRNWILRGLYELGVAPERLARLYRPHAAGPERDPPDPPHPS